MELDDRPMHSEREFTPAFPLLWAYDLIVATFGRERTWHGALLRQVDPRPSDIISSPAVARTAVDQPFRNP